MVEVRGQVGNERDGGYSYRMNLPCPIDVAGMTDAQRLDAFIMHQRRVCVCYAPHPKAAGHSDQERIQEADPEDGPLCKFCKVRCVADVEIGEDGRPTDSGVWVCPGCCWSPEPEPHKAEGGEQHG